VRDVLLVEDDRAVLEAVAGFCRGEGLQVDETTCVEEAVARLSESGYRVALVDLMLPERSGLQLLRGVRSARPPIATVMITGYATIHNALESFRLGAFDFLPKPFDVAELLGVVRRALRYGKRPSCELVEPGEKTEPRWFLGQHSWAATGAGGTATLGAAETFCGLLGDIERLDLPAVGDHVTQGHRLARLEGAEEAYRIWSPLSGQVIAVNPELDEAVDWIDRSPFGSGWLVRILPVAPEVELEVLTFRSAQAVVAEGG
jgi:CheY-like chemotaxis protein/glycine cleavage system H lipoate-binding protein